jgi:hypothetical protein
MRAVGHTQGWRAGVVVRGLACVAAAICLAAQSVYAQELRGIVRDSASRRPIAGAVMMLLDSSQKTVTRRLSGATGEYRITLTPNARTLRVLRIGFRPRTIDVRQIHATDNRFDVAMLALPTMLDPVNVSDQPLCSARADRARAFGLWEQARTALLSTVVSLETNPVSVRSLRFFRVIGETRPGILTQVVREDTGTGARAFAASRSASEFVAGGFRSTRDGRVIYHAPDAEVLLDEEFMKAYCFRLAAPNPANSSLVGLVFEPASQRRNRIDIVGTLWVDSTARRLEEISYRYVGLSQREEALHPGGHVVFQTPANGVPFITAWSITVVAPSEPGARAPSAVSPGLEAHETGAMLAEAHWQDTTSWQAKLTRVEGRLLRHGVPVGDTVVRLIGTPYTATTDREGRFEFSDVILGRYVFSVPDSEVNEIGLEMTRGQGIVVAGDSVVSVDVELPTITDIIKAKCVEAQRDTSLVLIATRVLHQNETRAFGAEVSVYQANVMLDDSSIVGGSLKLPTGVRPGQVDWSPIFKGVTGRSPTFLAAVDGETGSGGLVFVCGINPKAYLRIRATAEGERFQSEFATLPSGKRFFTLDIKLGAP